LQAKNNRHQVTLISFTVNVYFWRLKKNSSKTKKMKKLVLFSSLLMFAMMSAAQTEARLLRFPAIHGNQVVFTYAGDLYTVSDEGGMARKLTGDPGYEMFPRFSPDGSMIAFTGQYDGNTEVFVIPAAGGQPLRLTYTATLGRDDISDRMGPNNIVMTWTPDGKHIAYRSRKQTFNAFVGHLFMVPVDGGLSEPLPISTGGFCSFSPDGSKLVFNRVFREFRTWKYYSGGMADDVWMYDFNTGESKRLFESRSQDIFPMWFNNKVYFASNRDRIMNLFVFDPATSETRKLTNYADYDIKFPSLGDGRIIYEHGGNLHIFDLNTETAQKLSIQIADDFNWARNEVKDATENIGSSTLSPDGNRLLLSARGDIFTVPAKSGITRNLTQSSDAHDRAPAWSPDGKWIAFLSDMNGEYEIYIQKQDGSEPPQQITTGADTYIFNIRWSPDSKKILWNDKKLRLQFIDIESGKVTLVAKSEVWEYGSADWSPDSRWIAYSEPQPYGMNNIVLYNLQSASKTDITGTWHPSGQPVFCSDGKYLYFTSARDFNPIYSQTEWNHAYRDMSRIYLVTLSKDTPSPFAPENDEVELNKESSKESKSTSADNVIIDLDGIQQRIIALPVSPSNYWGIWAGNNRVYYVENSAASRGSNLKMYDLKSKKETELGNNMSFEVSADGKKMLIRQSRNFSIIDMPTSKVNIDKPIDLTEVRVRVNYAEEWEQIYVEAWRQMRDFFYVENMHGVDWEAMRDKYAVLLPYVKNRHDLNYIIGELIGELNVGHAYINGGDVLKPKRIDMGLLGAQFSRHSSGYYRIEKILEGANWSSSLRSPLTEIGVGVKEGEYIIAINGRHTSTLNDIFEALAGTAGKQVELTVNSNPSESGSRSVIVIPIKDEADLYYYNWVQNNIRKVDEATGGQVGYIHIPDMGPAGLNEFAKHFYPQLNRKALIIDDRGNGGGNVSPMILERLSRELQRANMSRNVTRASHTPAQMMLGPKVLLINQYSASDGDLFPYGWRKYGLGKIIGVTTWGGVVGIRGPLPFVDGADLRRPEFASYSAEESEWIIEGYGVEPDIWLDNDPAREFRGIDDQLNKAIEVILEELKNYKPLPAIPEPPDKTR
jgi:tricorn protease